MLDWTDILAFTTRREYFSYPLKIRIVCQVTIVLCSEMKLSFYDFMPYFLIVFLLEVPGEKSARYTFILIKVYSLYNYTIAYNEIYKYVMKYIFHFMIILYNIIIFHYLSFLFPNFQIKILATLVSIQFNITVTKLHFSPKINVFDIF
jgi:hypothetical protein